MQVFWLEQDVAEVPEQDNWLSATELVRLSGFHVPKRRQDWRLGRWTAKQAVAAYLKLPSEPSTLAAIEIRPDANGAPEAFFGGQPAPVSISLSHRDGRAACAVAPCASTLGCDLEVVESRSDAFVSDYFSAAEQQLISRASAAERFRLLALSWSAKESVLKALRTGLRMDVRCVSVSFGEDFSMPDCNGILADDDCRAIPAWRPFIAQHPEGSFHGWWQSGGNFVRTFVSAPQCGPPITLQTGPVVSTSLAVGSRRHNLAAGVRDTAP